MSYRKILHYTLYQLRNSKFILAYLTYKEVIYSTKALFSWSQLMRKTSQDIAIQFFMDICYSFDLIKIFATINVQILNFNLRG